MKRENRYRACIDYFSVHLPNPTTELHYVDPFQLLVAVILSAQCTDKRVNEVTPALFKAFPSADALSTSDSNTIYTYIRRISYPYSKSIYLLEMAKRLVREFQGIVPHTMKELRSLHGVGRKTASVILSTIYNIPAMPVDTHVMRVSKRIGLVSLRAKTPLAIERELMAFLPKEYVNRAHHWLVLHGRYVCLARRPKCDSCPLTSCCAYYEKTKTPTQRSAPKVDRIL